MQHRESTTRRRVRTGSTFASGLGLALLLGALGSCADPLLAGGGGGAGGDGAACPPADAPCRLELVYPLNGEQSVELRGDFAPGAWEKGVPMQIDGGRWRTSIAVQSGTTIRYKFFVNGSTWVTDPANPDKEPDGVGGENSRRVAACTTDPRCAAPGGGGAGSGTGGGGATGTTTATQTEPPAGVFDRRSATLYFVFVDRFRNGDPSNDAPVDGVEGPANYQGGDFQGVLDVIEEGYFDGLGISALWLTVPLDNPSVAGVGSDGHDYSAYHGYWPGDMEAVEEHFGDLALLKEVVEAAHDRGIKVLIDYAMNHVHAASPVYADYQDWFWPLNYEGKNCVCGDGCDWNDGYEQKRCWFRDYLPDWNFTIPEARAYSVENAVKWVKDTGVDGFRVDAVKHVETQWILDLRKRTNEEIEEASGQHFYMVGETFESGNRDLIKSYVDPKTLLDGQFDFPLRGVLVETLLRRSGSMFDLDGFLASNDTFYDPGVMSTFLGNHDIARIVQTALDQPWGAWDGGGNANWENPPGLPGYRAPFERLAVGFTFLFTTKGIPLVYYGDEIGMPGAADPDNRRFMQWEDLTDDQLFLRAHIQKLGGIRADRPALWKGTRTTVSVTQDTFGYVMKTEGDEVYVALNRGDVAGAVAGMPKDAHDLLSDEDVGGPNVTLPPRSAMILVAK